MYTSPRKECVWELRGHLFRVRRLEFKRIMPPGTINQMRRVAEEKARFQKEHMASKATPLRDTILLGASKVPVPKKLLRGYGLRRLGVLLNFDEEDYSDHTAGTPRLLQESRTVNQPTFGGSEKPASPQRRFSASPESLILHQVHRLEHSTKQAIAQVSPIRTMLGYSPISTPRRQNCLYHSSTIGSDYPKGDHGPSKQCLIERRSPLVPQSPRNSPHLGGAKKTPRQHSASGGQGLRSGLIHPESPRPRTAQGRSPRVWIPESNFCLSTNNRQSVQQTASVPSPVPALNLHGFGLK